VIKIVGYWTAPGDPADIPRFEDDYMNRHVPIAAKLPGLRRLTTLRVEDGYMGGEVEHYRIGHLVSDALAVAGPNPFHVVGHDWGGVVAWHLAAKHPERIRSLTALSVPHPIAFATALASPSSDQRQQSGYVAFFQTDLAEEVLLSGGLAAALKASGYPGDIEARVRACRNREHWRAPSTDTGPSTSTWCGAWDPSWCPPCTSGAPETSP